MYAGLHPGRLLAARWAFGTLLAAHGAAHFLAVARTVRSIGLGRPIELLGGLVVTSNSAVTMLLAVALAAAGTGFVAAAGMVVGRELTVGPLLVTVAVLSLAVTVVGAWGTTGGVLVNLAVLAMVSGVPDLIDARRPGIR